MSQFPTPDSFSLRTSSLHCKELDMNSDFVIKKAKGVYLYDIDGNKYIDFSLNHGTVPHHAPSRLTQFLKNVVSSGFGELSQPNKFLAKIIKNWQKITLCEQISLHKSLVEMVLCITKTHFNRNVVIGCTEEYLYEFLSPLHHVFDVKIVKNNFTNTDFSLIITDRFLNDSLIPTIIVHANVLNCKLYQPISYKHSHIWEYFTHFPFGGKNIGVLASNKITSYHTPDFLDSILYLEGSKLFNQIQSIDIEIFEHEYFDSKIGHSRCQKKLDPLFFLQRGIFLKNDELYFSSSHSQHDIRRLKKALHEYFTHHSNDNLVQK